MKKKLIILLVLIAITALTVFSVPNRKRCALCGGNMMWTGETKTEWGKLVYEMKCPANHVSWEVDEQSKAPSNNRDSNSLSCQYDGSSMYFTGNTKIEWGKLLKEFKCHAGHITWATN